MSLFQIIGLSLAAVLVYMTAIWLVSLALRNASIVDVFWGLGFALLAAVYFVATDGVIGRKIPHHDSGRGLGAAALAVHPAAELGTRGGLPVSSV